MLKTIQRILPDEIVDILVNTEFFICAYKATVHDKTSYMVKFEDCDIMNLTEESYNEFTASVAQS